MRGNRSCLLRDRTLMFGAIHSEIGEQYDKELISRCNERTFVRLYIVRESRNVETHMKRREVFAGSTAAVLAGMTPWPLNAQTNEHPNLLGYLRTNWSRDLFSFGTYSYLARGSGRRHHRQLAKPIANKVYLAGEASNPNRNSSVHAALESGRLVAATLLKGSAEKIGIIGAGIAGLSAAQILDAAGRDVDVIEARDRIGGRVNTDTSLGFAADLGATWLHGSDGNPLTEVTDQVGMRKAYSDEFWVVRANGRALNDDEVPGWVEEVSNYDNRAGASREAMNEWGYIFTSDYSGEEVLFPDGYGQIFDAFQGGYTLSLNSVVTSIDYAGQKVVVSTEENSQTFDAVIVTVPLGVLKSGTISFAPALPEAYQTAIGVLGYGTLDKIYLQFEDVFWDKEPHNIITPFNGFDRGYFNNWVNLYPTMGKPVLLCFNGGPAALALSSEPDAVVINNARKTILTAYGLPI